MAGNGGFVHSLYGIKPRSLLCKPCIGLGEPLMNVESIWAAETTDSVEGFNYS